MKIGVLAAATLIAALPVAADVVEYSVCCVIDEGFGGWSTLDIPTFDPSLGTLESVGITVNFNATLLDEGSGPATYWAEISPTLTLGAPLSFLDFSGYAYQSGPITPNGGYGFASLSTSQTIVLPPTPTLIGPPGDIRVEAHLTTEGDASDSSGGTWWLYDDAAALDVQYTYAFPGIDPVPEPSYFAVLLGIAIVGAARRRAKCRVQS